MRGLRWISLGAFTVMLVAAVAMLRLERGGPPRVDLVLDGGVPATLHLPPGELPAAILDPPPRGERPPAVLLMHGFSGDRRMMSSLARRLAAVGYAVLAIDAAGHGESREPFPSGFGRADGFLADLRAGLDFLRGHPFVDGSRLAVVGHSMGANAVLDLATRDSGLDAVVMISGGFRIEGPLSPTNALFLVAARDPQRIRDRTAELAGRLAGHAAVEAGITYGRPGRGDAVRFAVVPGVDHLTILWSGETVREVLAWLDAAFGRERPGSGVPGDPRLALLPVLGIALLLVLPGLGVLVGGLVPRGPALPADGRAAALLALAAALAVTSPFVAAGTPAAALSLEVADVLVGHFALAGIALLVAIRVRRPELLAGLFARPAAALLGAGVAIVATTALFQPLGAVTHGLALTPERALALPLVAVGFWLLGLPSNLLLRRGPVLGATGYAIAGRLLVLAVMALLAGAGVLHPAMPVMLPTLALVWLVLEALSAALYAASRNLLVVSVVDATVLALVVTAIVPIR